MCTTLRAPTSLLRRRFWPIAVCSAAASCWTPNLTTRPDWRWGTRAATRAAATPRRCEEKEPAPFAPAPEVPSAEEILQQLEESGLFEGDEQLLLQLRVLAAKGVHPLDALQGGLRREEPPREPMLTSFDVKGIAQYMTERPCQNVVVLCGAGMSTSAGIPDFRTPGSGLYDNLQRFNLSQPEDIFDLEFFKQEPGPFYELCKELWPGTYQPTLAHHFIRLLEEKGVLRRCYTQNIDSLERQAGVSPEKIVAAHGNMDEAHVLGTQRVVDIEEFRHAVFKGDDACRKLAEIHGGWVKPRVVLFGEDLPDRFWSLQDEDFETCDMLIVIGTSLVVEPFASLVGKVSPSAPRLLINREPSGTCDRLHFGFRFLLSNTSNWRDVWFEGGCDEGCQALCDALSWELRSQGSDLRPQETYPETFKWIARKGSRWRIGSLDYPDHVRKVWDLFDANEFHYDAEKGELTLQCGNERLRFRGRDSVLRKWFEKMRGFVPKEVQPSQTFQPPVRRVEMEVPIQEAGPSTPAPPSETVSSPSRKSRANSRASFFNKPLEHLKSNERLDPSVATTLSKPTQMLLAIYYQLDAQKLRTIDLIRRVDTSGDGEVSRTELRKGLEDVLGYTCSNDDFKELMRVLDSDNSGDISCKEMDRALKRAAKGEDLMVEVEEEAILHDAMIQVDTVNSIPITADTGDSMYVAKAKWKDDEKTKCPKTEARPG
ncbi:NAD-dependent protein deacetylase sirtuin-2 (Regulatory protein SIR2 homolog 2) (SIR2-like protein 2), partial [Durusdinium trenchii]